MTASATVSQQANLLEAGLNVRFARSDGCGMAESIAASRAAWAEAGIVAPAADIG